MVLAVPNDLGRGNAQLAKLATFVNNVATRDYGILRVAANVIDGETVTIGGDVYRVEVINTAIPGLTSIVAQDAVTQRLQLVGATQAYVVGDIILAGSELERVSGVNGSNDYQVTRAWAGTSAATHAANATMKQAVTPNTRANAGKFAIPLLTTLTPAAFIASFKAVLNAFVADNKKSSNVEAFSPTAGVFIVVAKTRGSLAYALSETLSGSGNAWDAAVMAGGSSPARTRVAALQRAATAGDVTAGTIYIPHDFDGVPSGFLVQVRTAAGVAKAWDGALVFTAPSSGAAVHDVQTVAFTGGTPTAGTVALSITDPRTGTVHLTDPLAYNATPEEIEDAVLTAIGGTEDDPSNPTVQVVGGFLAGAVFTWGGRFHGLVAAMTTTDAGLNNGASSAVTHTTSGAELGTSFPGYAAMDNSGSTDFAATDVINLVLFE